MELISINTGHLKKSVEAKAFAFGVSPAVSTLIAEHVLTWIRSQKPYSLTPYEQRHTKVVRNTQ